MEKPISSPSGMGGLIQCANGSTNIGPNVLQTATTNNGHAGNNSVRNYIHVLFAHIIFQYYLQGNTLFFYIIPE